MKEFIGYNENEKYVQFSWRDQWYKIPFIVLYELCKEKRDSKLLRAWLRNQIDLSESLKSASIFEITKYTVAQNESPENIAELRELLESEMQGMEAYLLYT